MVGDAESKRPNVEATARVMEGCRERGLLVGKGGLYGNVIRMAPPLVITEDETARAIETIEAAVLEASR
jgi:4-aminobutyrate aminotransferase-like enzyme